MGARMSILESKAAFGPRPADGWREAIRKGGAFLWLLMHPQLARKLGTLSTRGYLADTGWIRSTLRPRGALDLADPMPWATYPFVSFIGARLHPRLRVFEYGAGTSTLYYAARTAAVFAVEHDATFLRRLTPHLPANARVEFQAEGSEAYVHAVDGAAPFDLVIVDGRDRVRCATAALAALAPGGVLVLDDAERQEYAPAPALLSQAGFRRLDFNGLAAGIVHAKTTAVFYRPNNCLGL